ncbi:META domain-containing protein [Leucobacter sp.]
MTDLVGKGRLFRACAYLGTAGLLVAALTACANGAQEGDPAGQDTAQQVLGEWTSDEQGNPTLDFADDGTVRGTDGCNGISSTYTVERDRVLVEKFAATLMACPGVDDWLRAVREVSVDGDTMTVRNGAGEEIGTLQRASA